MQAPTSSAKRKSGGFFGGLLGKKKDSPKVCTTCRRAPPARLRVRSLVALARF